jgi:hypothetical protein
MSHQVPSWTTGPSSVISGPTRVCAIHSLPAARHSSIAGHGQQCRRLPTSERRGPLRRQFHRAGYDLRRDERPSPWIRSLHVPESSDRQHVRPVLRRTTSFRPGMGPHVLLYRGVLPIGPVFHGSVGQVNATGFRRCSHGSWSASSSSPVADRGLLLPTYARSGRRMQRPQRMQRLREADVTKA